MYRRLIEKIYSRLSGLIYDRALIPYAMPSLIYSVRSKPSDFLLNLALDSVKIAIIEHIEKVNNNRRDSHLVNQFPGEHYRLLNAITKVMSPRLIVEIGTYTGLSVVSMLQGVGAGKIVTYDVVRWNDFETHLSDSIMQTGVVTQILSDLSVKENFTRNIDILSAAEIIFLDGPKNFEFERTFLKNIALLPPAHRRLLIIDDIRFLNMTHIWGSILSPKLDLTSFGHWTGTGLVDISNCLRIDDTI